MNTKPHWAKSRFGLPGLLVLALVTSSCGGDSRRAPEAENRAPTANAGPDQTALVGATVRLDGSGSTYADGDPLSFSLSVRPNGTLAPAGRGSRTTGPGHPFAAARRSGFERNRISINPSRKGKSA